MGKRLAPILAVLVMLMPATSFALGLGNIVMNSALNQPLDAEIELISVQKGDLENLSVRLGAAEDFDRVGIVREFFYTEIKFAVAKKTDGTPFIKLSTTKPVTEPFMDFVVEARWARGRILREFTVLVDPPVLSQQAPVPVQQAAVAEPAPAPATAAPVTAAPVTTTVTQQPAMVSQPAQPAPIRERANLTPVLKRNGELSYGPVKYRDTLFEIANEMRPEGVTTNQMMLALAKDNPQAFYNGNINQLKAGYVLRIEDQSRLTSLTVAEADAEVRRQALEWEARKSGKIVRQTGEAPAGGRVARGEGGAAESMTSEEQARLKLVAPGSEGAGSGASDEELGRLRQDLLLAAEALDANKQETDELKARMAEMEEQLESMQRLIMLKDDEMLALQKQLTKGAAEEGAPEKAPEATMAEKPEAAMAEKPAGEAMMEKPAAEAPAKKPAKPAPVKPVKKAPEPGLLDDPMMMYGGIGLVVLLVAGLMIYRKRKMSGGFEESILNVGEGGKADEKGATVSSMEDSSESTMVSDFAMSEMSGLSGMSADGSDVDPVSEADVYLAYGRHQQAEDILNEALAKEPDRNDVKLKLLEVFFAAKNKEAFEKNAQELHDALGDSDPLWEKAVTMGSQLCPNNELFGGTSTESLKEDLEETVGGSEEDLMDFDFDLDSMGEESTETESAGSEIDDVFAELEAATSTEEPAAADDTSLDLDMGSEAIETSVGSAEQAEAKSDDNSLDFDVSSLDFNLDADSEESQPAEAAAESEVSALDMDLGGLELETETAADSGGLEMETSPEDVAAELDDMLGADIDELTEDAFGEVDEVGTKLDLAKAYVDMGDSDGAKSILDEVMEEGDDTQKAQAKELLSQIG